jgi:hypothetical protein
MKAVKVEEVVSAVERVLGREDDRLATQNRVP